MKKLILISISLITYIFIIGGVNYDGKNKAISTLNISNPTPGDYCGPLYIDGATYEVEIKVNNFGIPHFQAVYNYLDIEQSPSGATVEVVSGNVFEIDLFFYSDAAPGHPKTYVGNIYTAQC